MFTLLKRAIENMLLPPGILLVMIALALFFMRRRPGVARALLIVVLVVGYVLAVPAVNKPVSRHMETWPALSERMVRESGAQAIVVLGAGRYPNAPEYNGVDTLAGAGLVRVRYGARLHRLTGLPVLVSGGSPFDEPVPEAALMKRVMEEEFNVPVRWIEDRSRNTRENAEFSKEILQKEGITKVLVATHSNHMARAVESFREAELEVVPAPTMLPVEYPEAAPLLWIPTSYDGVRTAAHEILGAIWYWAGGN